MRLPGVTDNIRILNGESTSSNTANLKTNGRAHKFSDEEQNNQCHKYGSAQNSFNNQQRGFKGSGIIKRSTKEDSMALHRF